MIAGFSHHSVTRSCMAAALLVVVACVGLTDAKHPATSAPATGGQTYVVTFQGTGDSAPTSARALLDAFNEYLPKHVRTYRFNTEKRNGGLVGSICVEGDAGRDAVVNSLAASSKLKLLEVTEIGSAASDRGSDIAGETFVVVFAPRGQFKPRTAAELLHAFNEGHPQGVQTHHFRTRVERREDGSVVLGSVCVNSKADADAVAEHVTKSEKLELEKVLKLSAKEWADHRTLSQPSPRPEDVAAITKGTIHPGRGLDVIHVGDTIDDLITVFGQPLKRTDQNRLIWLDYRRLYSMDFLVDARTKCITEIRFDKGFAGALDNGLKIGSSLHKVLAAFDGASKTVDATPDETRSCKHGSDRVLYRRRPRPNGPITAYKFIDDGQGVLFWFDRGRKVTQIVVFPAKEAKAS